MQIDLSRLDDDAVYHLMIQAVIPRPIAWVLSDNGDGGYNLAPFSYFNAVASEPPLVMLSVGHKSDGTRKDTWVNIEARDHFVVHIAHRELLQALNETSRALPHGESEIPRAGLDTVPFEGFTLPRLRDARIAMACTMFAIHHLGEGQGLIIGRVHRLYIADEIIEQEGDRMVIHPEKLDPIARLGASRFAFLSDFTRLTRPK